MQNKNAGVQLFRSLIYFGGVTITLLVGWGSTLQIPDILPTQARMYAKQAGVQLFRSLIYFEELGVCVESSWGSTLQIPDILQIKSKSGFKLRFIRDLVFKKITN